MCSCRAHFELVACTCQCDHSGEAHAEFLTTHRTLAAGSCSCGWKVIGGNVTEHVVQALRGAGYAVVPQAELRAVSDRDPDRTGWYEFVMPGGSTTHIAYAYEDGSAYLPEGPAVVTEQDFLLASATNRCWHLVRDAEADPAAQNPGQEPPAASAEGPDTRQAVTEAHSGSHADCLDCGTATCPDCRAGKCRSCIGSPCACHCQNEDGA